MKRLILALLLAATLAATPALAVMPDPAPSEDADRQEGERLVRAGRYDLGIPHLQDALARSPQEPDIHVYLALALRSTGKPDEAAKHYEEALRLDPNHKGAIAYQGVLKLAQGDRAGAERNMARLRTLCPAGCLERDELARELARVALR